MNSKKDRLRTQVLKVLVVYFKGREFNEEAVFSEIYDCFYPKREFTAQQQMVSALGRVMNGNTRLMGARLGRLASALLKEGAAPEKVLEMYGPDSWWYQHYWKGQKGQVPNEADIRNTWDHWDAPKPVYTGATEDQLTKGWG